MGATLSGLWLDRPLAGAFLGFNLLPAGLMHLTRWASWGLEREEVAEEAAVLPDHPLGPRSRRLRHVSMAILHGFQESEAVVQGFGDPALPVFMASQACFERLALLCGLVPLIPSIRRIITRHELQALRAELSPQEFEFARAGGARWVPTELPSELTVSLGSVRAQARALGDDLLLCAIAEASPPVACRARLRLPADLSPESSRLPPDLRSGPMALALARGVLQEVDPEWLALFPALP